MFIISDIRFTVEQRQLLHWEYELGSDEDEKNRTQIAFGRIVSTFDQRKKNMAWSVLSAILVASNESPLKKAILEKDLGQDVELELFDGIQQPWAVLCVRNTEQKKLDEVRNAIVSSARDLVENGLDHDQIIACLNQMEFKYRERHEPAGLMYGQIGQTEYIIRKVKEESGLANLKVVATGGLGRAIADETDSIDIYDSSLTLDGLRIIYDKNRK